MFSPEARGDDFRRSLGLEGRFIVLYAGAHGISNDLGVVLRAAKLLVESPIHIVLVGDGKEKAQLRRLAQEMRLANVTFVDPVAKHAMPSVLAAADACIAILKPLPEYRSTYPNKVFDYMAAGRPVVLAIDGVIRQVVEAGRCGIYVEPGDPSALAAALAELAADRSRAATMGRSGRDYLVANFSRSAASRSLLDLVREMVS
jgi:glycosyltransferase involved in cell wall biosynthesis